MNQLTIKLTGEIEASNFDEWKNELVYIIKQSVTNLVSDDDFVRAQKRAVLLKDAERALKRAKQSAIEQTGEIHRLFSAIDLIAEEARQARLSLERQINRRKLEIKSQIVESGLEKVRRFIDAQPEDFHHIDIAPYVDRGRFESAIRGRSGTSGVQFAIDQLCSQIVGEVAQKTAEVTRNRARIEALPDLHRLLFQDWRTLIGHPEQVLDAEVRSRILRYESEVAKDRSARIHSAPGGSTVEGDAAEAVMMLQTGNEPTEVFRIDIELLSTQGEAVAVARAVRETCKDMRSITRIKLVKGASESR